MTTPGLKPCPFCGGDGAMPICRSAPGLIWRIRCDYLGCEGLGPERDSKAEAVEAWNRRRCAREKLRYCAIDSHGSGEYRHPRLVILELLGDHGKIVHALPIPIADAWWFWIERCGALPALPRYVKVETWDNPAIYGIEVSR